MELITGTVALVAGLLLTFYLLFIPLVIVGRLNKLIKMADDTNTLLNVIAGQGRQSTKADAGSDFPVGR